MPVRALPFSASHFAAQHDAASLGAGAGPTALAYLLPPVLQRLREHYRNIDLVMTTGTTNDIADRILSNTLDLGFTALPAKRKELLEIPVRTDPMVAILPATDLDVPPVITPTDVDRRTLILEYQRIPHTQLARAWLCAAGIEVRPAMEFDHIDDIKHAVAAGLGMALVPEPAVALGPPINSILVRPLNPPLIRTLGLIQRRNKPDDPALGAVRDEIMTICNIEIVHPTTAPQINRLDRNDMPSFGPDVR